MRTIIITLLCLISAEYAYCQGWQWARQATGGEMESWAVAVDAGGNVLCAGTKVFSGSETVNFGTFSVPSSGTDEQTVWAKYDPTGAVLWASGIISGTSMLLNIATDPSGDLVLFGFFYDTIQIGSFVLRDTLGRSSAQYFLAKINPSGTVMWAINDGHICGAFEETVDNYTTSANTITNGGVVTDASGNIYITADFDAPVMSIGTYTLTNTDASGLTTDFLIAEYSPSGTLAWAKSIGGSSNDYAGAITVSSTGYLYIAGAFNSSSVTVGDSVISDLYGIPLAFIAKFSPAGVPVWAQAAGGARGAFATALAKDDDGNVYMTGGFSDTAISFGATTLNRAYTANPNSALFLARYSSADTVTWCKSIGTPYNKVYGYSLSTAPCGQVWVTGIYYAAAVIDSGDTIALSRGPDPVFIAGYNLSGGLAGYSSLGSGGDDFTGVACDAAGNVFLSGDFYYTGSDSSFVIGPDTLTGLLPNYEYFYISKFAAAPTDTTYTGTDTVMPCNVSGITLAAPPGYNTWYWDNGSTTPSRAITASGTYFVFCGTCSHILADTFNVAISPDTLYKNIDTVVCVPSDAFTITLTAPTGTNYLWYDGTTSATHTESSPGNYWVSYTSGCNFITDTLHVSFIHTTPPCATGVENPALISKGDVEFYPNPANEMLTVKTDLGAYNSFVISNSIGQIFIQQQINGIHTNINIKLLPAGLYYINFTGENGNIERKFVKE